MANPEYLEILRQGIEVWNRWREEHPEVRPDLSGANFGSSDLDSLEGNPSVNLSKANFSGANLSGTDFLDANLSHADLSHADLSHANLNRINLSHANLANANLWAAFLDSANLSHADLSHTYLHNAVIGDADFSEANISHANVGYAIFGGADLRTTKGLVEIDHFGRSFVELHRIQLPQDGSAIHFLRGAGVSDEWIDFWRSTSMSAIQYHSLFISYSSKDEALAHRLHADLQAQGVRCWFAPEDMKIGDKLRPRINEAIHIQDKLLLLLSEHALASSWVEDEVEAAFEKEEKQQREVLFPVHLDNEVMHTKQAWAATIRRTRYIGDFTRWKEHDEYQKGLNRLLRDLKQEELHDTIESDAGQD